ncbi:MAG TPA: thiopeptide-type bacteriocin biosynthesis protein [Candidatus Polarisedimenticolaceae bacterium]|nr:thiopeptide-type bacteriocin biosynthesis protein [Candidatus Polarisedimenticolaceae bacterium]
MGVLRSPRAMRPDESCLYTLFHAPREHHEAILARFVIPIVRELRDAGDLDCIFFARYSEPDWQLRFRVLGRPAWVDGPVKRRIQSSLPQVIDAGLATHVDFARYEREWDRYGGEHGMMLAEQIFLHDSLASLDLIEAEGRGELVKSRREYSLLFVERFLDLVGFDRPARLAFYEFGHSWPIRDGDWTPLDMETLSAKYEALKPGLVELLTGSDDVWGGPRAAAIATGALSAMAPVASQVRAGLADRSITADPINLVWSYMHMHCNRLGIDAMPEAILRYFMWRLHDEVDLAA